MADYTEERRVKQVYPDAQCEQWHSPPFLKVILFNFEAGTGGYVLGKGPTEAEAWADASRRLGNEFVDEVGPLAERKEG